MLADQEREGVPSDTATVAKQIYAKQKNVYMQLHDELEGVVADEQFAGLFSHTGQPAERPWRLALVLAVQYMENLSDRVAAAAVRSRIDLKYLLELPLADGGFDHTVLCKFRERVVSGDQVDQLLEAVLKRLDAMGVKKDRRKIRTDGTGVLMSVRELTRLENVGETLRLALEALAAADPMWLSERLPVAWIERYQERFTSWHLPSNPAEREVLLGQVGRDGYQLMEWVQAKDAPLDVRDLPALRVLRMVWIQQFMIQDDQVQARDSKNLPPCAKRIDTPHDIEARFNRKANRHQWTGYAAHFSEQYGEDQPHYLVDVHTCPATTNDEVILSDIVDTLLERELDPPQMLTDAGYVNTDNLLYTAQRGIDLVGRIAVPSHHRFHAGDFMIDWQQQTVTCPAGTLNRMWQPRLHEGKPIVEVRFDRQTCQACSLREQCTSSKTQGRSLKLPPPEKLEALLTARQRQLTDDFKTLYRQRAGVEGTVSQLVRVTGLRRSRFRGIAKTHLHNVLSAIAINFSRWFAHRCGVEHSQVRRSPLLAFLT